MNKGDVDLYIKIQMELIEMAVYVLGSGLSNFRFLSYPNFLNWVAEFSSHTKEKSQKSGKRWLWVSSISITYI